MDTRPPLSSAHQENWGGGVVWSNAELAHEASVDPWELRDDLAEGNPAEIISLAQQFHTASGAADDAADIAGTADEITAAGYRVDDTPVHDVNAHLEQTRAQLGNRGEDMGLIASYLSTIADELATRTTSANREIEELEGDLDKAREAANRIVREAFMAQGTTGPLPGLRDYGSEMAALKRAAVGLVSNTNGKIQSLVDGYEESLNLRLKAMASMGYDPPDALDVGGVDPTEMDAGDAAQATLDAIDKKNPTAALEAYDNATAYVDILNAKARHGQLGPEEIEWLNKYYEKVAPHFGKIHDWLQDGEVAAVVAKSLPQHIALHEMDRRGTVLADGLLNLTQGAEYHGKPLATPIQDIVNSNLQLEHSSGYQKADTFTVAGLERASDFSGFLQNYASDDVPAGKQFATDMAEAGVRWKNQLDDINTHLEAYASSGHGESPIGLAAEKTLADLDDEVASDALTVAAHNPDAAASVLALDQHARRTVLGSDWEHDQGAADLVAVGTAQNPDDVHAMSNRAALEVMQDIAADPIGFNNTFGDDGEGKPDLRKVLTVMAVDHMDTFALHPGDHMNAPGVYDVRTPDGTQAVVGLSDDDVNRFLTFIGTDDQSYSVFRAGALERGSEWIEYGLEQPPGSGDPQLSEYQRAANSAARLEGRSAAASWTALDAMATAAGQDNREAHVAAYQEYRDRLAQDALAKETWNTLKNGFGGAAAIAGVVPGGQGIAAGLGVMSAGMGAVNDLWSLPNFEEPTQQRIDQLSRELDGVRVDAKYDAHFEATRDDAINWMLLSAVASTDPHDPALNGIAENLDSDAELKVGPPPGSPFVESGKPLPSEQVTEAQLNGLRNKYERDGVVWAKVQDIAYDSGFALRSENLIGDNRPRWK